MHRRRILALAGSGLLVVGVAAALLVAGDGDGAEIERPRSDSVDVGFLQDMIDHHEQAVLMSLIALRNDPSDAVRNFAVDVIASQRHELGVMDGWLTLWGYERGGAGRRAMGWMGMSTTVGTMPGMATAEELQGLTDASGEGPDRRFLALMIEHHEGGIHMSEYAQGEADNEHVRWLAGQIVLNQRREIRDMEAVRQVLGA